MARFPARGTHCAWGLALAALVLSLSAAPASAATYTSIGSHYSFDYPSAWTAGNLTTVDVNFLGAAADGFRPNVVAQHEAEPLARNDSAWLLQYIKNSFDALKRQLNVTEVQAPRTFTAASGRLAGDYVFERPVENLTLRQRQVFFVSEYHRLAFFLTLSDKTTTYASHSADWTQIVDSFAVSGEAALGSALSMPLLFTAVAGVALVAVLVLVLVRASARKARQAPPPAPPVGSAPLPPPVGNAAPPPPRGPPPR